ncbi:hypothetical protein ACQPT2_01500 [Erwinia amylovora]
MRERDKTASGPREERDITPAAERVTISQLTSRTPAAAAGSAAPVTSTRPPANQPSEPEKSDEIDKACTAERATELRGIIEEKKSLLGITLFTELKNKAVKRYHQVKAMADIEAGFENLSPDLDDAQEGFNRLFTLIAKSNGSWNRSNTIAIRWRWKICGRSFSMASKRLLRRRQCGQKRKRKTAAGALVELSIIKRRFGDRGQMVIYPCPHCDSYHVGHTPGKNGIGSGWQIQY